MARATRHFQKGLAGASPRVIETAAQTATNPVMREAFVLAIMGSESPPARPGLSGYQPNLRAARRDAAQINDRDGQVAQVGAGRGVVRGGE